MKRLAICLALMLFGCNESAQAPPIPAVTRVTTNPIPEATSEGSYELELIPVKEYGKAVEIRAAIQTWLETHRDRKIVSIVACPSVGEMNYITHVLIISEPKGK